jgi:hypothetical protein
MNAIAELYGTKTMTVKVLVSETPVTDLQTGDIIISDSGNTSRILDIEVRQYCLTCGKACVKVRFAPFAVIHYNPSTKLNLLHL